MIKTGHDNIMVVYMAQDPRSLQTDKDWEEIIHTP